MKALVTGSTGFLGRFLVKKLQERGVAVVGLNSKNCDLTKEESLDAFQNDTFDTIYHLAAWTQAGDFCLKHPGEQFLINQKINTNVLSFWAKKQSQATLVAMGTSCSYDPTLPLIEENYLKGEPIESLYTYAMTKRMLLCGLQSLQKQFGLNYLYLIPSTLYGPLYHTDSRQLHFIFDLMRKILRGKKYGEKVVLWGDGEQKRELIHVQDFVEALLSLKETNCHINIGSGKEHSIKEFANTICDIVGYNPNLIEYDTTKYVGARSKVLSIENLLKKSPSFSPRDLSLGLKETLAWFEQAQSMHS